MQDVQEYLKHKSNTFFDPFGKQNHTTDDSDWTWWKGLIDVLCYLPYPKDYCQKFVSSLKAYYAGNTAQIRVLEEFEQYYSRDRTIWYYTRDTFLYRLMNKALRQRNIELTFLFGFFLQDMYRQLNCEHKMFKLANLENPVFNVYRGQLMSRNEIQQLKYNGYILNNSFLSTTFERSLASVFLNSSAEPEDEFQNILFEIEIDIREKSRPYADISNLSQFANESEILFMIGTEFHIDDMSYDENEKTWIVRLKLTHDDDGDKKCNKNFESITKRTLMDCVNLLDDYEITDAAVEEIDTIFNELIALFPSGKWILAAKFYRLAIKQNSVKKNYTVVLTNYHQALKIWREYINDDELNSFMDIGKIHSGIGHYYEYQLEIKSLSKKHYDLAIRYYQLAIEKTATDYEKKHIFNELSSLYGSKMKFSTDEIIRLKNGLMAIKYKELSFQIILKYRSPDYEDGYCIRNLADLYKSIQKYDDALTSYEKALRIFLQQPEVDLSFVTMTCNAIISIYIEHKHDYHSALKYQLIINEYKKEQPLPPIEERPTVEIKLHPDTGLDDKDAEMIVAIEKNLPK
ncbi:unnamed protein product [Didymodactylos carnosus]|uniref:ADP ribosyltransferase domain-containing protein n=1 Tax=Didymodactylos carnosus TaxID=1234261 RepID=A0A814MZI1_9BILA|nr:unnamed protein product [Didymodactylos carnosus]CAF1086143.1 unnamed protein product [Didymodactylos carnosus]CAF3634283.1 unnamed protein product [Didymodactylos carnosus]CAF3851706.1 unnamed protein product [Didymodactylos carnosus]